MREDWESDVLTSVPAEQSETVALSRLVAQLTQEFQQCQNEAKPMGHRWLLGEIMCSSNSPLTQQGQNLGQQAFRFGLDQGDLASVEGRPSCSS